METDLIARADVSINAGSDQVWDALINPAAIKQYMFGTEVESDWRVGSPITWKGEFKGKSYEDHGVVLQFKPGRLLRYSHVSQANGAGNGATDSAENRHTVTITLSPDGNGTRVQLEQDHNATDGAREESEKNWVTMLGGLKKYVEKKK